MTEETQQVNLRMPVQLRSRLLSDAEKSRRSLSAEILHRVELTYGKIELEQARKEKAPVAANG